MFVKRNLDTYKLILEKNLLMPLLKIFAKREILLLAMQHYTYRKKNR